MSVYLFIYVVSNYLCDRFGEGVNLQADPEICIQVNPAWGSAVKKNTAGWAHPQSEKGCVQPPAWDEEEVLPAAQLFQLSRDSPAPAAVRSLLVVCIAHIAQQVPTNKSGSVTSRLRGCHGHDWKLSSCLACRAWLG